MMQLNLLLKNIFNAQFNIDNEQMNKEKFNAFGLMNNLTLDELCKKISNENLTLNNNIFDAFYDIKIKNKNQKRNQRIYVLTTNHMEQKFSDKNIDNYFIVITYHIIPKKFKKYKLMTITGVDRSDNNSYICTLILLKYEDTTSFYKIFQY